MKRLSLFIFTAILLGCADNPDQNQKQKDFQHGDAVIGLASPVKLNFDETYVYLLDYFERAGLIEQIILPVEVKYTYDADAAIIHITDYEGDQPIEVLSVVYDKIRYDIPIFKSNEIGYKYTYESPNPAVKNIALKGNFNGWNPAATPLKKDDDTWYAELVLEPGLYEYLVVEDGKEMLDPGNPNKKDNGQGGFNSTFRVGAEAEVQQIATQAILGDGIEIFYPQELNDPFVFWDNHQLNATYYSRANDKLTLTLPAEAKNLERSDVRIFADNGDLRTNDLRIPIKNGKPIVSPGDLPRTDKHKFAMYFMMIDRFVNGDSSNDRPVQDPDILPPANYYGGDLAGVNEKIEDGYIKSLGLNMVWLSPITQNPLGAYGLWDKGGVRSKFSGYHGYWPISSSQVDFRFGDEAILNTLLSNAHKNDMSVILDYVANHVHEEHPVYQNHPDWATDLYLPDGSMNTERWDEHRLTTWFDTFMPTLDLENPEVTTAMTDSALFWFENYTLDGFRHDATKHVPLEFWRELTRKLKYRVMVPENRSIYQIGETYGNAKLIDSYVGSGLLDAQFDFNIYDAAVAAFAKDESGIENLTRVLNQSLAVYGSHHLMGNISGNQDRARFISYADGSVGFGEDAKEVGWTRKVEINDPIGYSRLAALHAFNFTIPGVPVIYYGDEIGMPGANDPDSRRMMRFGDDLDASEKNLLEITKKLGNLRQDKMALLYGDLLLLTSQNHELAYARNYFDQTCIVFINTSKEERTIEVEIPEYCNLENLSSQFNHRFTLEGNVVSIKLPPVSFEILTN